MTWQDSNYVTDVGRGVCPICKRDGCMLKVRFRGDPAQSLDRPIESIYTNCCRECPGGLNTHIIGSSSRLTRDQARGFLHQVGNELALEMARRL